ncbi:MAG TPA: hypothetical protein VJK03_02430 [Candidatus Nanoarchaeia archaeon]|nr:hypothetical protein [Candidatus Nanoarchaeia archaeon]
MNITLLRNYGQVKVGDVISIGTLMNMQQAAIVDYVGDNHLGYRGEYFAGTISGRAIKEAILLRKPADGELEVLAGEHVIELLEHGEKAVDRKHEEDLKNVSRLVS